MRNLLQQQLPAVPWSLQFSHSENGGQLPDACEVETGEEFQFLCQKLWGNSNVDSH